MNRGYRFRVLDVTRPPSWEGTPKQTKVATLRTVLLKMPAGHSRCIVCTSTFPKWWTVCVETLRHRSEPILGYYYTMCPKHYAFPVRHAGIEATLGCYTACPKHYAFPVRHAVIEATLGYYAMCPKHYAFPVRHTGIKATLGYYTTCPKHYAFPVRHTGMGATLGYYTSCPNTISPKRVPN